MAVNRDEVQIDNKNLDHVFSAHFVQDPGLEPNSDIQDTINLYYTDLDIQDDNELFISPADAQIKAINLQHKFPNHIVKFFMFYYEANEGDSFSGVTQSLCQVVPGNEYESDTRYRLVKRKSLKSIYDKIDFITIYRPVNKIKWYEVSKQELNEELAVIKQFYGLSNFPDKTGDFYFSKKIGKWLATNELANILKEYKDQGREIPVLYPDRITSDGVIPVERKTIIEVLWDYIKGAYEKVADAIEDTAEAIKGWIGDSQFIDNFNNWFKDENNNYIPDRAEQLFQAFQTYVTNPASLNLNNVENSLKDGLGIKLEDTENITALPTKINKFGTDLKSALDELKNDLDSESHSWWNRLKERISNIFTKLNW